MPDNNFKKWSAIGMPQSAYNKQYGWKLNPAPVDNEELDYVNALLEKNKEKTFIDRIMNPDKYPSMSLGEDDAHSRFKMTWGESDGKYVVFPTILWDGKSLTQYKPEDAWNHVKQTGNYLEFDTPEEADWFSKRYGINRNE